MWVSNVAQIITIGFDTHFVGRDINCVVADMFDHFSHCITFSMGRVSPKITSYPCYGPKWITITSTNDAIELYRLPEFVIISIDRTANRISSTLSTLSVILVLVVRIENQMILM